MIELAPYKVDACTSLDDVREFLSTVCCPAAADVGLECLDSFPLQRLTKRDRWPGSSEGGGLNNSDWCAAWLGGARLLEATDPERWENCLRNAVAWVKHYHRGTLGDDGGQKDAAHSYLSGPHMVREVATQKGSRGILALADGVVQKMGRAARDNFNRYRFYNFTNTRLVCRSACDSLVDGHSYPFSWYLTEEFTVPKHGEATGWGVDANGIPFHAGEIGKMDYWYHRSGNAWYVPFQEFSIQGYALLEIFRRTADDELKKLIRKRMEDLHEWFWKAGYYDDEPARTGIGPTRAVPLFDTTTKSLVITPEDPGNMFYPCWLYLRGQSVETVGRMVDAMILQHRDRWPDYLFLHLVDPTFQELVSRWRKGQYDV
jgi:hypothetical protein